MVKGILNGELVDDPSISVLNKANFFGFSVYESVKVTKKKIHYIEDHIDRLFNSAKIIGIEHDFSKKDIEKWTNELVSEIDKEDCLLRFQLFGGDGKDTQPQLYIFPVGMRFYPDKFYSNGVKVITYNAKREFPKAKTNNLLVSYVALREAYNKDALEALLVDNEGNVLEGTRTNFFAIKGDTLVTEDEEVLDGVTRKHILEVAKEMFEIKFDKIKLSDIRRNKYDEYFMSSSSMGIMPIVQIDDQIISEKTQEKTRNLRKLFKERY